MPPASYLEQVEEAEVLSFDVACYAELSESDEAGMQALGFRRVPEALDAEQLERLSVFRNEARRSGGASVSDPQSLWRLNFSRPNGMLEGMIKRACVASAKRQGGQVFGDRPGWPSKWLVEELSRAMQLELGPNVDGLERICALLIDTSPGELGWVEPVAFQAICDLLAVVLQASGRGQVEWASSPMDALSGLAPPPMARIRRAGSWRALELGRDVASTLLLPFERRETGEGLKVLLSTYLR
ncbi:hypothetical protein DV096_02540 [Bradymonadaceae bacterium TMQ3]|uniref:Uncharacterized protein n=2 Tax=Lujinxingia sediminis TaxID=2480984 RepID=A0ABY0CX61_9DELT|nr:hypothetical protein DV096_02540 [Bradymonadaceae bacterium TMQ3]RVU48487.1 hypothetical protein EA187_03360 [Lujinxingia sediminis]TXC77789.1 hypothetical protein FRC91_03375 [Bradymonadales bacterium TMQ1]